MLLLRHFTSARRSVFLSVVFIVLIGTADAQSTDVRFATPVRTNEIVGKIPARDIGDSRLTDHFYAFTGVPGDLLVTIESNNLNGDLDVFTAGELRPLLKISIYAETASSIAKSIYLRKRESLILRVEARSPNDDTGNYRIRFSGSFEPTGGPLAESETPADSGLQRDSNVSSVGARIDRPTPEVAVVTPTPAPTPAATPERTAPVKPPVVRTARNRQPTRRTPPPKPATKKTTGDATTETNAATEAAKKKKAVEDAQTADATPVASATPEENKPTTPRRPPARSSTTRRTPPPRSTPAPTPPESGAKLVIEMNDGTRIEHFMNLVQRVTVENGVVVVVGKNGKVERVPMANVLHMSIGP
jgi:hypothetical protein